MFIPSKIVKIVEEKHLKLTFKCTWRSHQYVSRWESRYSSRVSLRRGPRSLKNSSFRFVWRSDEHHSNGPFRDLVVCRFTPRRRRLVTSSRASAPRVHTRETPLNFYSIFSRLPLSFYSSIPFPSLAKLYISSRRTCHDHVQRLSLSVFLTKSGRIIVPFHRSDLLSNEDITITRSSYSSPLERHSYHQCR